MQTFNPPAFSYKPVHEKPKDEKLIKVFLAILVVYALYSIGYLFVYLTTPTVQYIVKPTQSASLPTQSPQTLGAGASLKRHKAPTKPKTVQNPTIVPALALPDFYHTPVQPTPYITPVSTPVDPQLALNAQDRAQYRDKCISLSVFQGASYANIKDGYWASCVATQTNAINRAINGGQIFGTRYTEAKKLLGI